MTVTPGAGVLVPVSVLVMLLLPVRLPVPIDALKLRLRVKEGSDPVGLSVRLPAVRELLWVGADSEWLTVLLLVMLGDRRDALRVGLIL